MKIAIVMRRIFVLLFSSYLFTCQGQNGTNQAKYDYIASFGAHGHSSFALVRKNEKYGFIDRQGKEVVSPTYEKIYSFGESPSNWAKVRLNGLYGFLDRSGTEVVKPVFESIRSFGEKNVNWALVQKNGLYGFIDRAGNVMVDPALSIKP